jgi:hypothetical protein
VLWWGLEYLKIETRCLWVWWVSVRSWHERCSVYIQSNP